MAQLMDLITQAIGGDAHEQIAQQLGTNPQGAQSAIMTAVPMILAGLARNSATPGGAHSLNDALSRDHDGSILDNLSGFLGQPQTGDGAGILGYVLGDRQPMAQQAVASTSGLDMQQAGQLLAMVAPIVMGALGRVQRERNLNPTGLAGLLGGEHASLQQTSPGLMDMATKLLDKDGDGSIVNELGGIAGSLFGKR